LPLACAGLAGSVAQTLNDSQYGDDEQALLAFLKTL
jgi:hypothetical protein